MSDQKKKKTSSFKGSINNLYSRLGSDPLDSAQQIIVISFGTIILNFFLLILLCTTITHFDLLLTNKKHK